MKIGLLTYHAVCNFGANLQALSTVSFLRKRGCEVYVIDWYPKDLEAYYARQVSKEQQLVHEVFVRDMFPLTRRCYNLDDVSEVVASLALDAVIVGSDAVFSYKPYLRRLHLSRKTGLAFSKVTADHRLPNPFFADFVSPSSLKVFAMSASAQFLDIDACMAFEKRKLRKSLSRFSLITVRDRWTQYVVQSLLHSTPDITPDPVFAFNDNVPLADWAERCGKYSLPEKYVVLSFCSLLFDSSWFLGLYEELHKRGYSVVNLAMPEGCVDIPCDIKIDVPLSPLDWYAVIKNSAGYIGQRMHPMIVAFANLVPFYIFDHYVFKGGKQRRESSKIYDLLERAKLLLNYYDVKECTLEIPTVVQVCERLEDFHYENAETFLRTYRMSYFQMMDKILSAI